MRDVLETDTDGGTLEQTFNVISVPENLATEYGEAANFTLTFNINDRILDAETGVIDHIIVDGEVYPTSEISVGSIVDDQGNQIVDDQGDDVIWLYRPDPQTTTIDVQSTP